MSETQHAPTAAPTTGADYQWRQGGCIGAAIGLALSVALSIGLAPTRFSESVEGLWTTRLIGVVVGLLVGAAIGAAIGSVVPTDPATRHG